MSRPNKPRDPKKLLACRIVNDARRKGILTALPCEICGEIQAEAHHHDYDKPLDVKWLCRKHHRAYHKGSFIIVGENNAEWATAYAVAKLLLTSTY